MQIPIEQAYAEACQALGEEVVKARLLSQIMGQQAEALKAFQEADEVIDEATGIVKGGPDANDGDRSRLGSNGSIPDPPPEG